MNTLMAALVPVAALFAHYFDASHDPLRPQFWFRMSMALRAGFVVAYPMNRWLVARQLKHGMATVRPTQVPTPEPQLTKPAAAGAYPRDLGSAKPTQATAMTAKA